VTAPSPQDAGGRDSGLLPLSTFNLGFFYPNIKLGRVNLPDSAFKSTNLFQTQTIRLISTIARRSLSVHYFIQLWSLTKPTRWALGLSCLLFLLWRIGIRAPLVEYETGIHWSWMRALSTSMMGGSLSPWSSLRTLTDIIFKPQYPSFWQACVEIWDSRGSFIFWSQYGKVEFAKCWWLQRV